MSKDDKKWIVNFVKGYEFPQHSSELKSRILSRINDDCPVEFSANFYLERRVWVTLCLALCLGIFSGFLNTAPSVYARTFDSPFYFGFSTSVAENIILDKGVQNHAPEKS